MVWPSCSLVRQRGREPVSCTNCGHLEKVWVCVCVCVCVFVCVCVCVCVCVFEDCKMTCSSQTSAAFHFLIRMVTPDTTSRGQSEVRGNLGLSIHGGRRGEADKRAQTDT